MSRPLPATAGAAVEADAALPRQPLQAITTGFAYLALLAGLAPASWQIGWLGAPLILVAIAAGWRDLRAVARVLLLLACLSAVAAAIAAPALLAQAAGNSARLATLVVAVMLLSSTLSRSRDLAVLAAGLFSGRPLPRYLGLTAATGLLAVPLNFGSVALLATMLGRVIQVGGHSAQTRNAARALLRGFGMASICSPLSVSIAVTLTFLPTLDVQTLLGASLPFALWVLLLGAAFREREALPVAAAPAPTDAPRAASLLPWLRFGLTIGLLCLGVFALSNFAQMPYSRAAAISCLGAASVGLLVALLRGQAVGLPSMAHVGNELSVMCGSAFIGVMVSGAGLLLLGADFHLPQWAWPAVAFGVPWLIFVAGMVGVNAIVSGTLAGALLAPIWPASALLGLGVAMVSGWGLTVAGTPYTASSMLLNRITGCDAWTAALRWNMRLSLMSLLSAGLLGATLTWLMLAPA